MDGRGGLEVAGPPAIDHSDTKGPKSTRGPTAPPLCRIHADTHQEGKMPKILICDDDTHIRLLLEDALEDLEDEGVELLMADNGEMALELIARERPALVFLDVMMPKVHGFDVCRSVKKERGLKDVFVVLITGRGQETDRQKGRDCGADRYLVKPIKTEEVERLAREVLGR